MGKNKKDDKKKTSVKTQSKKEEKKTLVVDYIEPKLEEPITTEDGLYVVGTTGYIDLQEPTVTNDEIAQKAYSLEDNNTEENTEVVTTDNVDTLNVEQEQNEASIKENLEKNDLPSENDEKEAEENSINNKVEVEEEPCKSKNTKKPAITTNEMFGYNWMGQIFDY